MAEDIHPAEEELMPSPEVPESPEAPEAPEDEAGALPAEEHAEAEETLEEEETPEAPVPDTIETVELVASQVDAEETAAPAEPAPVEGPPKQWYIIHTYSGFEGKVAESLRSRAQAFGFADKIGNVLIPTEEVVEMRNGKKVISKRLLYPGYVLVEMSMDDQLWHEVKNTPRVTGFVGGGNNPVPLTADEVNSILYRQATSADRPRPKQTFEKNETVRIVDGPFASFSGKVDEINSERDTLRVMVTIFGRSTPVELEFTQVEKIS